jgi:exopolyphosphatase/guanosine-5'-triphosphate,3'-diphosphate pyrophosphatase
MSVAGQIGAAIDVGSNSVHLLVSERRPEGTRVVRDESVLLGLGAVVDLEGRIPDEMARAVTEAIVDYVRAAEADGAAWVLQLATEPLRRASNRSQFCDAVKKATGRPLHVLAHEEEAGLTVLGALEGTPPVEPVLLFDIGGGSSEMMLLEPDADPVFGVMPVGSARLTASFVEDDPPTAEEVAAMRSEAHHLLSGMPVGHPRRGIVTGGSGTNLVRLTAEEGDEDHGDRGLLDRARLQRAMDIVMSEPSDRLADRYGLRQGRILQVAAGASLIEAALDCYELDHLEASEASLRDGAILARFRAGDAWREQLLALIMGDGGVIDRA